MQFSLRSRDVDALIPCNLQPACMLATKVLQGFLYNIQVLDCPALVSCKHFSIAIGSLHLWSHNMGTWVHEHLHVYWHISEIQFLLSRHL